MVTSMTGFAGRKGQGAGASWLWDIRSVNGKGLDLRLRLPDWIEGLEAPLRAELGKRFQRGNVSLSLKVSREAGVDAMRLNRPVLEAVLADIAQVTEIAARQGVVIDPPSAAEVLGIRGVLDQGAEDEDQAGALRGALLADLGPLLDAFAASRAAEGAALTQVIAGQIDRIEALTAAAEAEAASRREAMAAALRENLARVLANSDGADETRVAQELAMLAVKADVTEEIDRLRAHVAAARTLMAEEGAVGRKFDFLMQEFNREANTLCSKAQAIALTRIGLDLKTVIDQMREQVQNVE